MSCKDSLKQIKNSLNSLFKYDLQQKHSRAYIFYIFKNFLTPLDKH